MKTLNFLWRDESGFVVSTELVLITTVAVIGMIVGLASVRDQVVQELADVAASVAVLNQTFSFAAIKGHHSATAGSIFSDSSDSCDVVADASGVAALCISFGHHHGLSEAHTVLLPRGHGHVVLPVR